MSDRPLDSVDLKVANTVMAGVAHAYGYRPDHERDPDADDLCECSHHHELHHDADHSGRCHECPCLSFAPATRPEGDPS